MKNVKYKQLAANLLNLAGIQINGDKPWDIQVKDERFFKRAITEGELGIGESYMDGWWDAEKLDELIYRIIRNDLQNKVKHNLKIAFQLNTYGKTFVSAVIIIIPVLIIVQNTTC